MLQLENQTPFRATLFVFPDQRGMDRLYVVVKATFDLSPKVRISNDQQPIVMADEYWGEPGKSSIKYASEAHLEKPGTDVVVVGQAFAPQGRPVTQLEVGLSVAGRTGGIWVFGDRHWQGNGWTARPSKPKPFVNMPLVYERAYGGMHTVLTDQAEKVYAEPTNPVGRGFQGKRGFEEIKHEPIANLEDPKRLISSPRDRPRPVGFGCIAPWWQPRVSYAGTYDRAWQKKRAPFLPLDFDPRFFQVAHPDWIFSNHLIGGEPVRLLNLSPRGRQAFYLPKTRPSVQARSKGQVENLVTKLETVLIEPTHERLCLVFRAGWPCDKKMLTIEQVRVKMDRAVGSPPKRPWS